MPNDKVKAEAEYKRLMKPYLDAQEKRIKTVNDKFMAGKMSLKEMNRRHKAINDALNKVATRMRSKVFKKYPSLGGKG